MAETFTKIVEEKTGEPFPTDPYRQLELAVRAVFDSWFGKRAHDYREYNKIPHDLGTAVNVVTMVFGNMGDDSGTGVAFTRDPNTGERAIYGEYLTNAQGEDVVAGVRTPAKISQMRDEMPEVYAQFEEIAQRLERNYRDMQDLEFTIERGTLYMLQTRSGKRTAPAAVKIAVDMANEGLITREEALQRVDPAQIVQLLLPRFDEAAKAKVGDRLLGKGLNASPGAAVGQAIFDPDRAVEAKEAGNAVDPRAHRDVPGRRPRHARRQGRAHRAWRGHLARRGRRALDGPAVRRRRGVAEDRLRRSARCAPGRRPSRRATSSASTARPARSSPASCRRSRLASRTSTTSPPPGLGR